MLQSKLASLAAEAQVAQAAATSSFEWRGLKCSLPLEKLRVPLHNAKELAATLSSAMDTGREARGVRGGGGWVGRGQPQPWL